MVGGGGNWGCGFGGHEQGVTPRCLPVVMNLPELGHVLVHLPLPLSQLVGVSSFPALCLSSDHPPVSRRMKESALQLSASFLGRSERCHPQVRTSCVRGLTSAIVLRGMIRSVSSLAARSSPAVPFRAARLELLWR